MNRFFYTITQFLLFIDGSQQSNVKQGITAIKAVGKSIKKPFIKTFANNMKNSVDMFRQNKNTLKKIVCRVQEKFQTIRHNIRSDQINYLKNEGLRRIKHAVPQATVASNELFRKGSKKGMGMVGPLAKKSSSWMKSIELGEMFNMVSKAKPQLPFAFVTGGLSTLTEFNLAKKTKAKNAKPKSGEAVLAPGEPELKLATFGGGSFWTIEACFLKVEGIVKCVSGYAGGIKSNPTFENTNSGENDNAQVVQVTYDNKKISYKQLMKTFFVTHDPRNKDQQGTALGKQYRSIILHHDAFQKQDAENHIIGLNGHLYHGAIETVVQKYDTFTPGEDCQQNYLSMNPGDTYCRTVIIPKLVKFKKAAAELQKK